MPVMSRHRRPSLAQQPRFVVMDSGPAPTGASRNDSSGQWRAGRGVQLADRRRVLDAASAPQLVQPPRNLQLRFAADIAVIDLAVIADMADDAGRPVLV